MQDYEPHPIALEYPSLSVEDFAALRRDIKAKGLLERITLYPENGPGSPLMILDGWHRYQCCVVEGIEARFEEYEGDDPHGFAESKNFHRRHLTLAQRKEHAQRLVETNPDKSSREIGRRTGLTHHTVETIRREAEEEIAPNGEIDHQQDSEAPGSSSEPAVVSPVPPVQRLVGTTKSGEPRKAPGRKPLTAAEKEARKAAKEADKKAARAAASALVSGNNLDRGIAAISAQFHSHVRHALEAVVAVVEDHSAAIQEKVSGEQRSELLEKFAEALGFQLPVDF
jgi:hypothetical protein